MSGAPTKIVNVDVSQTYSARKIDDEQAIYGILVNFVPNGFAGTLKLRVGGANEEGSIITRGWRRIYAQPVTGIYVDLTPDGSSTGNVQIELALAPLDWDAMTNRVVLDGALPAGSNIIGKVGIDQTTPGTTNRVDVGAALPAGANVIGKVGVQVGGADISAANPIPVEPPRKATYRAWFSQILGTTGGVFFELRASTTKTVRVTKVFFRKPSVAVVLSASRRSSNGTGGTLTDASITPVDQADSAPTAVVKVYTAPPTGGGALVGDFFTDDVATSERSAEAFGDANKAVTLTANGGHSFTLSSDVVGTFKGFVEFTEE